MININDRRNKEKGYMINKLDKLISELEAKIPDYEKINLKISQANVGWHIEHTLLALHGIVNALSTADSGKFKWQLNVSRIIVFTFNKIPRGRAKAPKIVQPKTNYDIDSLRKHVSAAREKIKQLNLINKDAFFKHPSLGNLKLKQAVLFMEIHGNHHLEIINDILQSPQL
jgi:hypothetical protein